ncbi:hypothetical protein DVS28_b0084 (plasmid) [Euzebya pacifica]|uniref:Uncharacterized protein n=1 Tax=Euzebya pacifica TaxID=1608957 RepID=A0A346Y5V7_9ACTN|nr:hypothetical protein [Euzebya pacifica]AXV09854.1 hypothetical protein DVS28_b0084 [Euzebya pacifica]
MSDSTRTTVATYRLPGHDRIHTVLAERIDRGNGTVHHEVRDADTGDGTWASNPPVYADAVKLVEFLTSGGKPSKAAKQAIKDAARSVQAVTGLPYATARQVVTEARHDLIPHGDRPVADCHPVLAQNDDGATWAEWVDLLIDAHLAMDGTDLDQMAGGVIVLLAQTGLPVRLGARVEVVLDGEPWELDEMFPGELVAAGGHRADLPEWGINPNPAKVVAAITDRFGFDRRTAEVRPFRPVDLRQPAVFRGDHREGNDPGLANWHTGLLGTDERHTDTGEVLRVYDLRDGDYGQTIRDGLRARYGDAAFAWERTVTGVLVDGGPADSREEARAAADAAVRTAH